MHHPHLSDHALHDLFHFRVAQSRLGLPLKLGVGHAHRHHCSQTLADVVPAEVDVPFLEHLELCESREDHVCVVLLPFF